MDWWITQDGDEYCRELYERHYSCYHYRDGRTPKWFVGPGEHVVLRTYKADALFVWRFSKFPMSGQTGVNCAVFRNESKKQSSDLIRQADAVANFLWPHQRRYTFVNAKKIRSINPGYCFKRAGWSTVGKTQKGLIILANNNVR